MIVASVVSSLQAARTKLHLTCKCADLGSQEYSDLVSHDVCSKSVTSYSNH